MEYTSKKQTTMNKGMKKDSSTIKGNQSSMTKSNNPSGQKGGQSSATVIENPQDSLTEDTSMESMAEDYNTPNKKEDIGGSSL